MVGRLHDNFRGDGTTHLKRGRTGQPDNNLNPESGTPRNKAPRKRARSHHPEDESNRGRPAHELTAKAARCLIRLFVKTGEKLKDIQEAFEKAGGTEHQWTRGWLEDLTGTGKKAGSKLCDLRLRDRKLMVEREGAQNQACEKQAVQSSGEAIGPACGPAVGDPLALASSRDEAAQLPRSVPLACQAETYPTYLPDERRQTASGGKRRKLFDLHIPAMLKYLDSKSRRLNEFIMRSLTVTEPAIQSRAGTGLSGHRADLENDYERYYHAPALTVDDGGKLWAAAAGLGARGDGKSLQNGPLPVDSLSAVALLMRAKVDSKSDIEVQEQLIEAMSSMSDTGHLDYVCEQDRLGVTALHLATAYGYPRTCGSLLSHRARHKTKTYQGSRPHDFALPAERLAGLAEDMELYAQIMLCREHVRYNRHPPVSQPDKWEPGVRRSKGLKKTNEDEGAESKPKRRRRERPAGDSNVCIRDHAYADIDDNTCPLLPALEPDSSPPKGAPVDGSASRPSLLTGEAPMSCMLAERAGFNDQSWLRLTPEILRANPPPLALHPRCQDLGLWSHGHTTSFQKGAPSPDTLDYSNGNTLSDQGHWDPRTPLQNTWPPTYESLYSNNIPYQQPVSTLPELDPPDTAIGGQQQFADLSFTGGWQSGQSGAEQNVYHQQASLLPRTADPFGASGHFDPQPLDIHGSFAGPSWSQAPLAQHDSPPPPFDGLTGMDANGNATTGAGNDGTALREGSQSFTRRNVPMYDPNGVPWPDWPDWSNLRNFQWR